MKKLTNAQIREQVRKDLTKSFQKKYEIELKSLEEFKRLYHKTLAEKEELAKKYFELNKIRKPENKNNLQTFLSNVCTFFQK